MPEIVSIRKQRYIAGRVAYTATVSYPGEPDSCVSFLGSVYGGPVVMVTEAEQDGQFVTDPNRFGRFGPDWVRQFFA